LFRDSLILACRAREAVPHFTLQISPNGPILQALIGVSEPRRAALAEANQVVPKPVLIRALMDTGASCTCVDPTVLRDGLHLTPTGSVPVNTPSTGTTPHEAEQYDVALVIPPAAPGQSLLVFETIPVVCSALLDAQGFHALIGRDILERCIFIYNGTVGSFSLAY
jgi:hypothetical protein